MKTLFSALALLPIIAAYTSAHSATLIESKEPQSGIQKTWIEGSKLRVETGDGNQYMLMDFANKTMHLVNPEKQQVMDMSKIVSSHSENAQEEVSTDYIVTRKGDGPVIAGYPTEHYVVSHKEVTCFQSFTSRKAVEELGLQDFMSGMNAMFPNKTASAGDENPCRNAENALNYDKIGLPLRLFEQKGEESYVIIKLKKNATVPKDAFSVPAAYQVIDYGQMVEQMMQQSEK